MSGPVRRLGDDSARRPELAWREEDHDHAELCLRALHQGLRPELAAKALEPYRNGTIGFVGTYQMSYAMLDYIKRALPKARYVDASDMVDNIKSSRAPRRWS